VRLPALSTTLLNPSQDALAEEMQALGPDLLEATAHAKTMTPDEIEETIDYLLNEVLSPSAVTAGFFTHIFNLL